LVRSPKYNMTQNVIQTYLTDEEEKIIEKACLIVSLNKSTFLRSLAIKEARRLIKEEGDNNATITNT